jgi:WD40 repeat protein
VVTSVAFSPDGRFVLSGNWDNTMKLWDATTGQEVRTFKVGSGVHSVAFSSDGRFALSGGSDNRLKLWEVSTGKELRNFSGDTGAVHSAAFSPDGRFALSVSGGRTLKLWDTASGRVLQSPDYPEPAHLGPAADVVWSVAFSPDGRFALTAGFDMCLWDLTASKQLRCLSGDTAYTSVAFSPSGRLALSGSALGPLKLWDVRTGAVLRNLSRDYDIEGVAFSPDGRLALASAGQPAESDEHTLMLWEVATGKQLRSLGRLSESGGKSVAFSPDGRFVLAPNGNTLVLFEVAARKELRTFRGHSGQVESVAFSPDGRFVLSGSDDNTLKLWEVATGKEVRSLRGHTGRVWSAAFSPNGRLILSGSDDGTARIWDAGSGRELVRTVAGSHGDWLTITPSGFFAASRPGTDMLAIVRGLELTASGQVYQSLFDPDLVREMLADDPDGEVARAATVINLNKVLDSGPAPEVEITSHSTDTKSDRDLVTVAARIKDRGKGIGRIEWRVNGVTTGIANGPTGAGPDYEITQTLALDPGENAIEVVAYNARNLLASLPAQTTITYDAPADAKKPQLYVLSIGVNAYHDEGWTPPGATKREYFPPLKLAVDDARSVGEAFKQAGSGIYRQVIVRTAFDEEATAAGLERIVKEISAQINPRDTFVLFAAAHGYSNNGHFYLLPQDYQGGTDPTALISRAVSQDRLQDWIANRFKARRAIILLDTCESGALTNGYAHSRTDAPASEAAVGRLHEATGRAVLTAAAAGKPAFEGYQGHGVFTWALIDALFHGDANGDGLIELSELAAHVQNTVPKISAEMNGRGIAEVLTQLFREDRQSAHFGSTGGDFPVVQRLQ